MNGQKSMVIVSKVENGKFSISVSGKFGGGYSGVMKSSAEEAATFAAGECVRYNTSLGVELIAPSEVRSFLPADFPASISRA